METNIKYAVIGGGSWATAIVKMLTTNESKVGWYMRSVYAKEHLLNAKHNPNYLSSVEFNTDKLLLTNDINEAVTYADYIIFAVPSAFLSSELEKLTVSLEGKVIFSAIKGIVPETGRIVGEHFHEKYQIPYDNIGVITGPCHAEEVALERLSYLTIACADAQKAKIIAKSVSSHYIKTKITEMRRFIKRIHRMKRNINNSAYLGDLLVTGYSIFSRNRMFGNMIGKGYTVKSAMMEMNMIAEGYYATKSAHLINVEHKRKGKTPILNAVYEILYEGKDAKKVFQKLTDKLD